MNCNKVHVFKGLLIFVISLFFSQAIFASDQVSKVTLELYPEGYQVNEFPIKISIYEKSYIDGLWVKNAKKIGVTLMGVEQYLANVIDKYSEASTEEILGFWSDGDKEEISKMLSQQPELLEKNKNFYRKISGTRFAKQYFYGPFRIVFVQHKFANDEFKDFIKGYIVLVDSNKYYLTNKLLNDPFYMYLADLVKRQVLLEK